MSSEAAKLPELKPCTSCGSEPATLILRMGTRVTWLCQQHRLELLASLNLGGHMDIEEADHGR